MLQRLGILISGILVLFGLVPHAAQAQSGPVAPVIRLAGNLDGSLYAATQCGVYARAGGAQWAKTAGIDGQVHDIVQLQDGTLIAASDQTIYRRPPGGAWSAATKVDGFADLEANRQGTIVYALSALSVAGVTSSTDAGQTWQPTTYPNGTGSSSSPIGMAVLPGAQGNDTVYVAIGLSRGAGSRLYRSTNSGFSWAEAPGASGLPQLIGGLYADADRGAIYVVGRNGDSSRFQLYRGTPDGAFTPVGLPAELAPTVAPRVLAYGATIVLASESGVFRSTDGGASWQRFDQGVENRQVFDLLYVYRNPIGVVLFMATEVGVFGRSDSDNRWQPYSEGLPSCGAITPFTPIPPFADTPTRAYFAVTGHSLNNGFKAFYERNGALPVFGYPLSEEFDERNVDLGRNFTTQYLERERFEYHPENQAPYQVLLGRLGSELLTAQGRDWRSEPETGNPFPGAACQSFAVGNIQRSVCGPFLDYWRTHGLDLDGRRGITFNESLALFGLPLTAPKVETNPDGQTVLTQWFERARFEFYPNNPNPYKVQLGRLGAEVTVGRR